MPNISSSARGLLTSAATSVFRVAGKWLAALMLVTVTAAFGSCSGSGGGGGPQRSTVSYTVSGTVVGPGWGGSVVIQLNGGDDTTVVLPASGVSAPFTFSTALPIGTPYAVTVLQAPPYSPCAFFPNGQFQTSWTGPGTADVTNVQVHCNGVLEGVGATVSGLLPNQSVTVKTTASQPPGVQGWPGTATGTATTNGPCGQCEANGIPGFSYTVAIVSQPVGETCTGDQQGTVGLQGVTVAIVCTPSSLTIGGTVTGLSAGKSVVLQDNGGNATTVSANGPFNFSTSVAYQSPYAVTVSTQPTGESCAVTNGSGTVPGANVTNVTVVCAPTADAGLWTWEGGANTTAASFLGVYGTQGTAAPGNFPGGRGDAAFSWTDGAGNLWMFGGGGPGNSGVGGLFNDLWRYSPSTGLWAWMSGADTLGAQSVYGTRGAPAAGNVPSAREGGASWIDGAGNLWLFGGGGFDSTGHEDLGLSDLWRYSPSTGLWTWVNGPTTGNMVGVYGTLGTAAPANVPGGRTALVSFKDGAGNFWLFGGAGFDSIGNGNSSLNDLWHYSPSSGMWTWVSGSNRGNAKGVYGTQGTAAAGNVPGARSGAVSWTDGAGNFWVFGGSGYDSTGSNSTLNDLWRYSPSTNLWTWMGGSNQGNSTGVYGTQGTAAAGNVPGARSSAVAWIDSAGNLWLFSGYGYDSVSNQGVLNDLWRYSPSTNLWTWMGGSTTQGAAGVYGSEGTAAAGNSPGARQFASSWTDGAGNLWLFGGVVPAALNDLWKYAPPGP